MTPHELTIWLQGVTDALGDQPPNAEQWARIKEQLKHVGAAPAPAAAPAQPDFEKIFRRKIDEAERDAKKHTNPFHPYPPYRPYQPDWTPGNPYPGTFPIITCSGVAAVALTGQAAH